MLEEFFEPRPWLALFTTDFVQLRQAQEKAASVGSDTATRDEGDCGAEVDDDDDAICLKGDCDVTSLPTEVLFLIFSHLEAEQLSMLAQVCRRWLPHAYEPKQWRRLAINSWPKEPQAVLEHHLYEYKNWRRLVTRRPRLRCTGIYVVRHRFAKTATRFVASEPTAPVFMISYYRFLRFYSDGSVISLVTPESPDRALKRVRKGWIPSPADRDKSYPNIGTYVFDEETLTVIVDLPMFQPKYPEMHAGTQYLRLQLASTVCGAYNRLFLIGHYALMDHAGGAAVPYDSERFGNKPYHFVPIWGFKTHVFSHFPADDDRDLAQWYEMKRESRRAAHSSE